MKNVIKTNSVYIYTSYKQCVIIKIMNGTQNAQHAHVCVGRDQPTAPRGHKSHKCSLTCLFQLKTKAHASKAPYVKSCNFFIDVSKSI